MHYCLLKRLVVMVIACCVYDFKVVVINSLYFVGCCVLLYRLSHLIVVYKSLNFQQKNNTPVQLNMVVLPNNMQLDRITLYTTCQYILEQWYIFKTYPQLMPSA